MHISRRKHERSRSPACRRGLSNSSVWHEGAPRGISRPASTGYNKPDGMVQKRWCLNGVFYKGGSPLSSLIDLRSTG